MIHRKIFTLLIIFPLALFYYCDSISFDSGSRPVDEQVEYTLFLPSKVERAFQKRNLGRRLIAPSHIETNFGFSAVYFDNMDDFIKEAINNKVYITVEPNDRSIKKTYQVFLDNNLILTHSVETDHPNPHDLDLFDHSKDYQDFDHEIKSISPNKVEYIFRSYKPNTY